MSIIYSYPEQGALNANDMLIGTSTEKVGGKQKNITRNFSIQQIADFINQGTGFVDPVASDFQIPVFNQEGKKITGSIMSQNTYPNGSAITITGSLTATGPISTVSDLTAGNLTASGVVTLGSQANLISLNSNTRLNGPILDVTGNTGLSNQILISNGTGNVYWQNYEAGLTYEGTWNASTNTPTLTSGQGVSGHFYIVNVAGNTNLDGNNDWHVGDWAVFFDAGGAGVAAWQKIDNTSVLTGSGTANTFAMWTATETLNDSLLSQDAGATKVIVDGLLEIKGDGTSQDGRIKLNCWNNNHGVTIQAPPHSAAQSWTWILPQTVGGANDVLTTDGNTPSQLSWTTPTVGTVTGTGTENYVTKWSAGGTGIQNSTIFDNGTNVGIGTTSPNYKLSVDDYSITSAPKTLLQFDSASIDNGGGYNIDFRTSSNDLANRFVSRIRGIREGAGASSQLSFWTDDGSSLGQRMTINSSGNVGIGTDSPSTKLHLSGVTNDDDPNLGSSTAPLFISNTANSYGLNIGVQSSGTSWLQSQSNSSSVAYDLSLNPLGGNVGIGTDIPNAKLDVNSGTGNLAAVFSSSDPVVNIKLTDSNGSTLIENTGGNLILEADRDDERLNSYIAFEVDAGSEKMRINNSGNVGIGTTSPAVSLDISATDAVQMPVGVTNDRPTGANGMLRYNSTNNGFEGYINGNWGDIGGGSSGGLIFRGTFNASTGAIAAGGNLTSGATRVAIAVGDMYIVDTAGDFYGDTSKPLNVGDEVICVLDAAVGTSDVNDWNAIASGAGGAVTGSGTTNYVPKFTGATVVGNSSIFNDASGNVGIGTSSPSRQLTVNGTNSSAININSNTSNGVSILAFGDSDDDNYAQILLDNSNNKLQIQNGGGGGISNRGLTLDSSENVGIGTSSPDNSLHVLYDDSSLYSENTNNAGIQIENENDTTSTFSQLHFRSGNSDSYIRSIREGSNLSSLAFLTDNGGTTGDAGEAMRIDSDGRVGIGTDSPQVSLDLSANNDAILVPNGDTAARPSGILPGMIRYNTETSEFEGYSGTLNVSGSWGALGGGGLPTKTVDTFTGSGQSFIELTVEASDKNYIDMYIDGVYQAKATYSISTVGVISRITLVSGTFPTGVSIETVTTT